MSVVSSAPLAAGSEVELKGWKVTLISPDGSRSVAVHAEVADTDETRARGLMDREQLDDGAGMLFLFEDAAPRSFWMKNTLIPLDIIFFDAEWKIISIKTMTPCLTDPCPMYSSDGAAKYALEVNAGFVKNNGITKDWSLAAPW